MASNLFDWKLNEDLKKRMLDLTLESYRQSEMLDFLTREFSHYNWSIRTLQRRLNYFAIKKTENVPSSLVTATVEKEIKGPGGLLGYRAMYKKIRKTYNIPVKQEVVRKTMLEVDPHGVTARRPFHRAKKKIPFTSKGPNWVLSLDGHDKLMGFQNSTFPIAIYGCIDTCSRKILWARVWTSNSDPRLIGRFYLEYLYECKTLPPRLRIDKGTETGKMATIHAYLRKDHDDVKDPAETVMYGPSTSNQIERWWKELHERLEKFFKHKLKWLKDQCHYDPHNDIDRYLLAYIMIPIIQREVDIFVSVIWNTHRIREQKNAFLPAGVPSHMYEFPEKYGLIDCGWPVTSEELDDVASVSKVFESFYDYLPIEVREKCQEIIADPMTIKSEECHLAFLYLKSNYV